MSYSFQSIVVRWRICVFFLPLVFSSCWENENDENVNSADDFSSGDLERIENLESEIERLKWENSRLSLKIRTVDGQKLVRDKRTGLWHFDVERNPYTGRLVEYRSNNKGLLVEAFFYKGKRDGVERFWHENGKLKSKSQWFAGRKNGLSEEWDDAGQLIKAENYTNGKLSGP